MPHAGETGGHQREKHRLFTQQLELVFLQGTQCKY